MIKLYTFTFNKIDFIELQYRSFQKYLKEDFIFTVFNNAAFGQERAGGNYDKINAECRRLGIPVLDIQFDQKTANDCQAMETAIRVFNSGGSYTCANVAHAYAFYWAWKNVISKDKDPVCILDFDMFMVSPTKLTDRLKDHEMCFVPQGKPNLPADYIWPGFVLFDMSKLPEPETMNWWCGSINGSAVDVGGHTCLYLAAHPELRTARVAFQHTEDNPELDFHPSDYQFLTLEKEPVFLHYYRGSNWHGLSNDYHEKKTNWLKKQLNLEA